MIAYVLTPLAKADIVDIWAYIAEKSEIPANRVEQAIYDACGFWPRTPIARAHSRSLPFFTSR